MEIILTHSGDPAMWKQNVRHLKRMKGEEYITRNGVVVPEKKVKIISDCSCRFNCSEMYPPKAQEELFRDYYKLADTCKQKAFLSSLIVERPVTRRRSRAEDPEVSKKKSKSRYYYLPSADGDGSNRVCLKFMCNVFGISFRIIDLALRDTTRSGVYIGLNRHAG